MRHRQQLRPRVSSASSSSRISAPESSIGATAAPRLAEQLPRDDVGVVLHRRDDDLVSRVTRQRPNACATRLMPSVELRVKTISRVDAAFRNARTLPRATSWASVAISLRKCTPRCTLALQVV